MVVYGRTDFDTVAAPVLPGGTTRAWWLPVAVVLLTALPLLRPIVPPLTDLPGHMARFQVEAFGHSSAALARHYSLHWALTGNLGLDLVVTALAPLIGVELATKLLVLMIPPTTAAGMLLVAREAHGRIPATAWLAVPLVYAYPFQFGFANYSLSVALLFLAVAGWMHLGRTGRFGLRAALSVPLASILYVTHTVGWGLFGLAVLSIEFADARMDGETLVGSARRTLVRCLPLAPSALLLLGGWVGGSSAGPFKNWHIGYKIFYLTLFLKNDWRAFDIASALLLFAIALLGGRQIGFATDRRLGAAATVLGITFIAMPGVMLGSAFADMRILPYAIAFGLLALSPRDGGSLRALRAIAAAALLFCVARLGEQTIAYWTVDRDVRRHLAAIDAIPYGARVFVVVPSICPVDWPQTRLDNIAKLAVVRRDAFVSGLWPMPGGRMLDSRNLAAGRFAFDPAGRIPSSHCRRPSESPGSVADALAGLPRQAFDYVWLIGLPETTHPRDPWLVPVRVDGDDALYRIVRPGRG